MEFQKFEKAIDKLYRTVDCYALKFERSVRTQVCRDGERKGREVNGKEGRGSEGGERGMGRKDKKG